MTGVVTADLWADVVARQIDEGAWQYGCLFDCTAAAASPVLDTLSDVHAAITKLSQEQGPRGPVAAVMRFQVWAQYRRQLQTYINSAPYRIEAFTDQRQALEWLGVAAAHGPTVRQAE